MDKLQYIHIVERYTAKKRMFYVTQVHVNGSYKYKV